MKSIKRENLIELIDAAYHRYTALEVQFTPSQAFRTAVFDALEDYINIERPVDKSAVALDFITKYIAEKEAAEKAGKCWYCGGTGILDGQFSGGGEPCSYCNGTGKK